MARMRSGGVINIITKKGGGTPVNNIRAEGGSYGTGALSGSTVGSKGPWSYAVTGSGIHSDSFSAYGYRVPAVEALVPRLESDPYNRLSGSARVGYDAGDGVRFNAGVLSSYLRSNYDETTGGFPSQTPAWSTKLYNQANETDGAIDTFDGALDPQSHDIRRPQRPLFSRRVLCRGHDAELSSATVDDFIGDRVGAEYQGVLRGGAPRHAGPMARRRRSRKAQNSTTPISMPVFNPRMLTLAPRQETRSLFASVPIALCLRKSTCRLAAASMMSSGRTSFETWRATGVLSVSRDEHQIARQRRDRGQGAVALPALFAVRQFDTPARAELRL